MGEAQVRQQGSGAVQQSQKMERTWSAGKQILCILLFYIIIFRQLW